MTVQFADKQSVMQRAIALASRGIGFVEPNPAVGAVIVDENLNLAAEGHHQRFGGPHAEINALSESGIRASGATLFVTLEPCCHHGKTPPCTTAIIEAGIRKVVVGMKDPAAHVNGAGVRELEFAGIDVEVGLLEADVRALNAPFVKLVSTGLPYVHAKWAMTLDGKIASRTGASQWISNEQSREIVHRLRGRMDAIVIGSTTALKDGPQLTARPRGPRVATRVILDSRAVLSVDSQLVRSIDQAPVLVAASSAAVTANVRRLEEAGVEVLQIPPSCSLSITDQTRPALTGLLHELGRRGMTNVLVEGGGRLLGSFFDQNLIDAVHVFIAPKLIGGDTAIVPIAGIGRQDIPSLPQLDRPKIEIVGDNVYICGSLLHKMS